MILPCTSSSCGFITTIKVTGNNFPLNALVEITNNGSVYGENTNVFSTPDAELTNINSTEILMDFYHLPKCTTFGVQVAANGQKYVSPTTLTTSCI